MDIKKIALQTFSEFRQKMISLSLISSKTGYLIHSRLGIFLNSKTSARLSIQFTIFMILVLSILGIIVNAGFFFLWYHGEYSKVSKLALNTNTATSLEGQGFGGEHILGRPQRAVRMPLQKNTVILPKKDQLVRELIEHKTIKGLSTIDQERVIYYFTNDHVILATVSHFIHIQIQIAKIRLFAMLIISGITYFISRKFINYSLRGLRDIAKFVQHINPNNLEERLVIRGPKDDEIRQISAAINTSLDQIEQHNHQLKSFVQFASHELKTPLMTLSAQLDLLERNNDVNTFIIHQKFQINQYNKLLEKLLLISQHEYQITQLQPIDIVPIITSIIDIYKQQLDHKSIYRMHPGTYITNIDIFLFQSCITNLLQNAHHYSSGQGEITISLDQSTLTIHNTHSYISPNNIKKIFERFWKQDSHGHGLGLYITKLFIEKHGRSISASSDQDIGTTFTIEMFV